MDEQRPKVGVGVVILKEGKILLGKRLNAHGEGGYAGPGGHLEYMESFADCAKRETLEECGVEIENVRLLCLSHVTQYAPHHFVDIGVVADWKGGEPQTLEPHKCAGWAWYDLDDLPLPLFGSEGKYIEALRTGQVYHDTIEEVLVGA